MNGASDSLQAVREITVQTEVARCRICEKVRGMSPEDAMEVMAVELNAAGINVRVISGPDAARVD